MDYRRKDARTKRDDAANLAHNRPHPKHIANGDEQKFRHNKKTVFDECDPPHSKAQAGDPSYLMSFTKGLPHNVHTGLINNPQDFQYLIRGIDSGDVRDFRDTPLGHEDNVNELGCEMTGHWHSNKGKKTNKIRAWESQSAGLSFELEGPDAQAVTMPPHPSLGSAELTAEMAEVYAQALLRDEPFNAMTAGVFPNGAIAEAAKLSVLGATAANVDDQKEVVDCLNKLKWFKSDDLKLTPAESARRRGQLSPSSAFRGITQGDDIGPYISQFLLVGNRGLDGQTPRSVADGRISYGAQTVDQRVQDVRNVDYLDKWDEWLDVQNGADFRGQEEYVNGQTKFIAAPRDLATYVHHDALYQAYLNACLIMLGNGVKFDPGIPFQEEDRRDHQQGFAHFGGPHILSLVTEVATRALKAVRFQKYNVHRRCRPEVLAARIHKYEKLKDSAPEINAMIDDVNFKAILDKIDAKNAQYKDPDSQKNYLLPMAFCEGSPMHPAYGAGHATVAGACVTILKAFFDCKAPLSVLGDVSNLQGQEKTDFKRVAKYFGDNTSLEKDHVAGHNAGYVSSSSGHALRLVPILNQDGEPATLTVEGELNKLASNISIGRDWAGVHYFTDYYESLLMGEQIAIGILEEQKLMFGENFSMTIPLFGGGTIRI